MRMVDIRDVEIEDDSFVYNLATDNEDWQRVYTLNAGAFEYIKDSIQSMQEQIKEYIIDNHGLATYVEYGVSQNQIDICGGLLETFKPNK